MRQIGLLLRSLRPEQWTKNLLIFAPLIFSRNVMTEGMFARTAAAFGCFCLLTSGVYLINDLFDLRTDRSHPIKQNRPLASGRLKPGFAWFAAALFLVLGLTGAELLGGRFVWACLGYVAIQLAYSVGLKHVVVLDVLLLSMGFILRVVGGGLVIEVAISDWLLVCTMMLALFLALCKRRHELVLMGDDAGEHRRVLREYTPYLLDQMIAVVTASTVMAYTLYTIAPETQAKFGTRYLVLTVPFVLYGVLRYLYLVHQREGGGRPERLLLTDPALLIDVALWATAATIIIYHGNGAL